MPSRIGNIVADSPSLLIMFNLWTMDTSCAHKLVDLTSDFYRVYASSFAKTRQAPWRGWHRILKHVRLRRGSLKVLDLACGNMRFEKFLSDELDDAAFEFHAYDNCPMQPMLDLPVHDLDVIGALGAGTLSCALGEGEYDLCVAFGLLHHVPLFKWRRDLIATLMGKTSVGGIAAMSFWQFMKDARLSEKAACCTERGCALHGLHFDEGSNDYLLGWQSEQHALRYCHNFDDDEIERLVSSSLSKLGDGRFRVLEEYSSDGKSDDLNRYVVVERLG